MPRPGFRLILKTAWFFSGLWGWVKDCSRDLCRAENPEDSAWYKSSWKHQKLGVLLTEPVYNWRCGSVFWWLWRRAVQSIASTTPYTKFRNQPVLYTQEIPALCSTVQTLYEGRWCRFDSPKYELGKVAFGSMFLKRTKSQRFGASSFSKCHYTRQKISLPP